MVLNESTRIDQIHEVALTQKFLMLKRPDETETVVAPFTLNPSPFPRALYEESLKLQDIWNRLIFRLAQDAQFLEEMVSRLQNTDDFVSRLFRIEKQFREWNATIPTLVIARSDYLLHKSTPQASLAECQLKQVEINTIASSFAGLSTSLSHIRKVAQPELASLPHNTSLDVLVESLAKSIQYFDAKHAIKRSKSIIIVQPHEKNIYDQSCVTQGLLDRFQIEMVRLTLAQVSSRLALDPDSKCLHLDGVPVSLIYYRAGYVPSDYPAETEWQARSLLESSNAIKCPSVSVQLIGMKKAQQMLAEKGVLEKYLDNPAERECLRKSFMGLYPLDDAASSSSILRDAIANPDHYVLKPQREGGGNNLTGAPMTAFIEAHPTELPAYILMEKIISPSFPNTLVRLGTSMVADSVSELGVYGTALWDGTELCLSASAGYLLRTKTKDTNEGGVAAGYAYLDTPDLQ